MMYNPAGRSNRAQDSGFYGNMRTQPDVGIGATNPRPSGSMAPRYNASRQQRLGTSAANQQSAMNTQSVLLSQAAGANANGNTVSMLSQQGGANWSPSRYAVDGFSGKVSEGTSQQGVGHMGLTGLSQVSFHYFISSLLNVLLYSNLSLQ